jgi:queuine/archaeosine tRNA-ribosyltransferase
MSSTEQHTARCNQCRNWSRGPMADLDYCKQLTIAHANSYHNHRPFIITEESAS